MQKLYNELSYLYDAVIYSSHADTEKESMFLDEILRQYTCRTVLDIACGAGRHLESLARKGYKMTGIDNSAALLALALQRTQGLTVELFNQDVGSMSLDRVFDAAICMWTTFPELPYEKMLSRLTPMLAPAAVVIIDNRFYPRYIELQEQQSRDIVYADRKIPVEVSDRVADGRRERHIIYHLPEGSIEDYIEIPLLDEQAFIDIFGRHKFSLEKIFYDFRDVLPTDKTNRVQYVFVKD